MPTTMTPQYKAVAPGVAAVALLVGIALLTGLPECQPQQLRSGERLLSSPPVTVAEAENAVRQFTGDERISLRFNKLYPYGPVRAKYMFDHPATGGDFSVDAYAGSVSRWYLGTSEYAVPEGRGEDEMARHERRLIDSYFSVPSAEMVRASAHGYCRKLASGAISYLQTCGFSWSDDETRVEVMMLRDSELAISADPLLSYEDGLKIASGLIHGIPGIRVKPSSSASGEVIGYFPFGSAATVEADNIGVQNLTYSYLFHVAGPGADEGADATAHEQCTHDDGVLVCVDARSGYAYAHHLSPEHQATAGAIQSHLGQLRLKLGDWWWGASLGLAYPPVARDGHVYFCWRYLQSRLWPGEILKSHDPGKGVDVFHVTYGDTDFVIEADNRSLVRGGEPVDLPAPPLVIGDELWLPGEAIELITGWRVLLDQPQQTVTLEPPGEGRE